MEVAQYIQCLSFQGKDAHNFFQGISLTGKKNETQVPCLHM